MILRTLELKHFGKFGEQTVEFRRGMNLVVGPNESGKSTMMEAIPAVLYGLRNKERFRPWGRQGSCDVALSLEHRDRTVRIERDIVNDQVQFVERDDLYHVLYQFEGKVAPQGRSSERTEYLDQLERLLGLTEDDLFRSSLFLGQGHLDLPGQGNMAGRIKSLLSGFVEVDYDRVLESLLEDYFSITRENPWGKDKTKDRELDLISKNIKELEERWFSAQKKFEELATLRESIGQLEQSIETDRSEFSKGEKYLAWVRRQWHLEEKETVLRKDFSRISKQSDKVKELLAEKEKVSADLSKTGLPKVLPEDLPVLLAENEEIRRDLKALQGEEAELQGALRAHANPPCKGPILFSGLMLLLAGCCLWLAPEFSTYAWWGGGLLIALMWTFYSVKAINRHSVRSRLQGQMQALETRRDEVQDRLEAMEDRFERLGLSRSPVEIVKMQKNLERYRSLQERLKELDSALNVLEKAEELNEEQREVTRELAVLDERRERERPPRSENLISPEELPDAEEKLAELGESIREREKELLELTRREASLAGELADLQQLEEEGERLKERQQYLSRRKKALATGYELLLRSVEDFRQTYVQRFAEEIGRYLAVATRGRYQVVRLDEDFSISLPGKGDAFYPLEFFSRGTVDAVYLAVRLALTRHLSSGRELPLLMDDPLVNFDSQRLQETLSALEHLSREHQIIFFSHDENLLRRAAQKRWNVISLDNAKPSVAAPPIQERSEDVGQLSLL